RSGALSGDEKKTRPEHRQLYVRDSKSRQRLRIRIGDLLEVLPKSPDDAFRIVRMSIGIIGIMCPDMTVLVVQGGGATIDRYRLFWLTRLVLAIDIGFKSGADREKSFLGRGL